MTIRFYSTRKPYGELSNFARYDIEVDGLRYPTLEHFYQSQKFAGTQYAEAIRRAPTPGEAASLGRSTEFPLRQDWDAVRDDVMRLGVRIKFESHPGLLALLLGTGDQEIVEDSPRDAYWGSGREGRGRNMLGRILMEVREALREMH